MFKHLLMIGIGGGVGSALRYLVSFYTAKYYAGAFPLATFFVNILGCFLIGLFAALATNYFSANTNIRLLLIAGFCGGYTTFSTFAFENLNLLQYHNFFVAGIYIVASIVLGIVSVGLGLKLGITFIN